jgi:hypothetical protein
VLATGKTYAAEKNRPNPGELCQHINDRLQATTQTPVTIIAIRWTAKSNMVIMGGPNTTPSTLQTAAPFITEIITDITQLPPDQYFEQARPNIKWSKISINGVPTGVSDQRGPYTHAENHDSFIANNPSYAALTITQPPSWVKPPTSYTPGSISSLSLAFEDNDGSKLKALLAERFFYVHGHRVTIRKWKQCKPPCKDKSKPPAPQHTKASEPEPESKGNDEEDVETQLQYSCLPTAGFSLFSTLVQKLQHTPHMLFGTSQAKEPTLPPEGTPSKLDTQAAPNTTGNKNTRPPNPPCNAKGKQAQQRR